MYMELEERRSVIAPVGGENVLQALLANNSCPARKGDGYQLNIPQRCGACFFLPLLRNRHGPCQGGGSVDSALIYLNS